jgi:hypothetical protein
MNYLPASLPAAAGRLLAVLRLGEPIIFSSRKGAETQRNRGPLLPQAGPLFIALKELKTT